MTSPARPARASERVAVAERRAALLFGDDPVASLVVRLRLVPASDAERSFEDAVRCGTFVEDKLIESGALTARRLRETLESEHFCASVDLARFEPDPALFALVPRSLALRHLVVPLESDGALRVAMADPSDVRLRDALASAAGMTVRPAVALRHELRAIVESCCDLYASGEPPHGGDAVRASPQAAPAATVASSPPPPPAVASVAAPVRRAPEPRAETRQSDISMLEPVGAVNALLRRAFDERATDVHVEPGEEALVVRFRIDGVMRRVAKAPKEMAGPVTSRLKVLGRMDIAERRMPQDGRATLTFPDGSVDLRVSSLPCQHGEKIVMRLLRKDGSLLDVDKLHMRPEIRARHQEMIDAPMGLFLVTGPTGSGKTTTLYATLAAIDRETASVVTLEDPIEYALPGITQVQIHDAAGMTFAAGLRSILRQDPDVILLGEIRDVETAEIACRAALTGHKVLSTLHANDACQSVTRLLEMGVSPHLVTATLKGVVAQRLLRRSCAACRVPRPADALERELLRVPEGCEVLEGPGCSECGGTGYRGRMAVHEHFRLEPDMHRLVLERAAPLALRLAAQRHGMTSLLDAGRRLVLAGDTTPLELHRVLLSDDGTGSPCPGCRRLVQEDYSTCPHCSHALRQECRRCRCTLEAEWTACPKCGESSGRTGTRPHCGRCAAPLDASWTTCPFCGGSAA